MWKIYLLDPQRLKWRPIGGAINRATAEHDLAKLRRLIRGAKLQLAWEGERESRPN